MGASHAGLLLVVPVHAEHDLFQVIDFGPRWQGCPNVSDFPGTVFVEDFDGLPGFQAAIVCVAAATVVAGLARWDS